MGRTQTGREAMTMTKRRKFWTFQAAADEEKVGELLLYGPISDFSWWGDEVTPKQFKEELDALGDIDELRVYINSPGGDVFAGQAILSVLKRHSAHKVVYVDGLAASAASVVAMGGDVIRMPRNAMMMIHNAWTITAGNANDLREVADALDRVSETMIAAYAEKTGLDRDEIRALLDAETWMTAEEAVEKGFADEIEEAKQVAASLRGDTLIVNGFEFDVSRYRNKPPVQEQAASDNAPLGVTVNIAAELKGDDLDQRIAAAVERSVRSWKPPDERRVQDDARDRKLKLLSLELELLSGRSF